MSDSVAVATAAKPSEADTDADAAPTQDRRVAAGEPGGFDADF